MKYYKGINPKEMENTFLLMNKYQEAGTSGIEELTQLQNTIGHMTQNQIFTMIENDLEVAMEILINCWGNATALNMYKSYLTDHCGWISESVYSEVRKKYEERYKRLQSECDSQTRRTNRAVDATNRIDEENTALKNQIIYLKACLFDAYKAGFSPDQIIQPDTIEE